MFPNLQAKLPQSSAHGRRFAYNRCGAKCIRAEGYSTHSWDVALSMKVFPDCWRRLEYSVSTKVSRIWNLVMSFFFSCQLTMDRDDNPIA
jgi:hypothetical protein